MRILFVGEASFVHNTLQRQLRALGHEVTLMSDGNAWHNSPRDIDVGRNLSQGKWGGVKLMWRMLRLLPHLRGYDIVQITNPNCVPLRMRWNILLLRYLHRCNRRIVMGCFGDDPVVISRQLQGALEYSDIYWDGKPQMQRENEARICEMSLPECWSAERNAVRLASRLVPCLYEYQVLYDIEPYRNKLTYQSLPIDLPPLSEVRVKGEHFPLRILVGIQRDRDYLKGAAVMAEWLQTIADEHPDKVQILRAENVPYAEYCRMLDEADVMVDQLYSYTPAMNALAAMARGTVVIGGGEEEYYRFIGEQTLRPIINVRPDRPDESLRTLREVLLQPGRIAEMSRQSRLFVEKYHDARLVAQSYEQMYRTLLAE